MLQTTVRWTYCKSIKVEARNANEKSRLLYLVIRRCLIVCVGLYTVHASINDNLVRKIEDQQNCENRHFLRKRKNTSKCRECASKENWNLFVDMLRWQYDGKTFNSKPFAKATIRSRVYMTMRTAHIHINIYACIYGYMHISM